MTQIERMPRPTGVTILAQQMNKAKSKKLRKTRKEKLISHIVNIYTMSGFRLNDRTLSIPQLAHLLNTKVETIQSCMLGTSHTLEAFKDPQRLQDTAAALANMSTLWAIQDRGTIQHQLEILLKSQGDKYAPFISGEISRILSTLLQSNKQVAEIFRTFYASGSTININNLTQNNQSQSLTVEEAYKIVQTSQPKEIQTDNIKQAKILDQPQLKLLEEKEHISLDILHKYDHIDNSISKARSEKRIQQIEDVDWIEDTIPELQKQLNETEDKTLRQRIQDKILTLQKAEERKSKGQAEDWEEEESPTSFQDIDDITDSLQKEKQNKEIHQSSSTLSISNSKESTYNGMDLGLGSGIPYLDGVSESDEGCNQAVSGFKDSDKDSSATNQGKGYQTGPQFLGIGKDALRAPNSQGQDSLDGLKDLDPKPQTALNPNPVSGNKGPISLSPKKKRKYQYGDTIQPLKAKDKKAQRHLKSLARRQVDVIEDDTLPNRE